MPYTHVIFDLDDTLVGTELPTLQAWKETAKLYGKELAIEDCRPALGVATATGLERLGIKDDGAFARHWIDAYARIAPQATWFPGIPELLDELMTNGVTLGIATSREAVEMDRFFSNLDLAARFTSIINADDTTRHKPNPEPLLACCAALGAHPKACLYVGDMPSDLVAASAAGMDSALVTWGHQSQQQPDSLTADQAIFATPDALLEHILQAGE